MSASPPDGHADLQACTADILDVVPGVMNALRASMRRHIGEGLSVPQYRCLGYIGRNPAVSVSEVADFLGVTLPTASAMVDRLVKAGYVLTATSTADRRRCELRTTAAGRALVERIRADGRADLAESLAEASPEELAQVRQGLAVLKAYFRRNGEVV